jgi:hypothetical protein
VSIMLKDIILYSVEWLVIVSKNENDLSSLFEN